MKKEYAQYLLNKTRQDYNSIAKDFSSTRRFVWRGFEPLYNYASTRDKVLDLGCGNGRLLQIFRDIDIDYTGVDSSEELLNIAQKIYPNAKFKVGDALHLPFSTNYFDKVYSIAVLHHIPSEELRLEFLEGVKRVLRPGGLIILTVWDLWRGRGWRLNLKYGLLKVLGLSKLDFKDIFVPWGKNHQRYIHCFTKKELICLTKKAGFTIKETGILKVPDSKQNNVFIVARK
ncbi:MAG: class I SAM-dependent methyltransferase [Candidatus Nealsonbacteria bacterium]